MDKISNQLELYNGIKIPAMGFGVWQIAPIHTSKCVKTAIRTGYRNIDTAEGYMNEKGVGEGVRQAMDEYGLRREDIFVSTKLWNDNRGYDKAMKAFEVSLKKLGLEYLDLLLLHQQVGDYMGAWKDCEKAVAQGKLMFRSSCAGISRRARSFFRNPPIRSISGIILISLILN